MALVTLSVTSGWSPIYEFHIHSAHEFMMQMLHVSLALTWNCYKHAVSSISCNVLHILLEVKLLVLQTRRIVSITPWYFNAGLRKVIFTCEICAVPCAHFCQYREYQRITDPWEIMILRFNMMFYVIKLGGSRMRGVWGVCFTNWKTKCLSSSEYDTDFICLEASATQLFSWRRSTEMDHNSASTANEETKAK